ncbi:phosphoglycerate dehydrogenase [Roseimarinus sediminis]|uniref:phosphoglycerate dehydrogenase n=1 Tax=Roseimarinus sediminis TaxID=1610899 RepID=UPI003D22E4A7
MEKYKILITTYPFGKCGIKPLEILESTGHIVVNNPLNRRLRASEIPDLIKDFDIIIAGTEPYPIEAIENSNVKAICRVGIGLDNVPLNYCKEKGITVAYTPDAPSQGVAELTVANILNLSRMILKSDHSVREGAWNRYLGFLLEEMTIGLVGLGRIGSKVAKLLQPFNTKILATEIIDKTDLVKELKIELVDKETLFRKSDLISLHIPSNKENFKYTNRESIAWMKTGSFLINTSRGPVVDEDALYDALIQNHLGGAALDVFNEEPYEGNLTKLDNVIFTAHMGASAQKSRFLMELGAAEDCIHFINGNSLNNNALIEENLKVSKD